MAKLTRENRLRERRLDKRAKKESRKLAPAQEPSLPDDILNAPASEPDGAESGTDAHEHVIAARTDL